MQTRINQILETLWKEIKTDLNDDKKGMDVKRLEKLLVKHSRKILTELGKSNIPLPPAMVDNLINYALPNGIDPLIHSVLHYLKIAPVEEKIYLDPLDTVKNATTELREILEGIDNKEIALKNLAGVQYIKYKNAITNWENVVLANMRELETRILETEIFSAIVDDISNRPDNPPIADRQLYLDEIRQREKELINLKKEFTQDTTDHIPFVFFIPTLAEWKKLMVFNNEEEMYWSKIYNRNINNQNQNPHTSSLHSKLDSCKKMIANTLDQSGLEKGAQFFKPDKQIISERIDKRIKDYGELAKLCETHIELEKAQAIIIAETTVVDAQIKQLDHLEEYLTSVIDTLSFYVDKREDHDDDDNISLFLKFKKFLGMRQAAEECESLLQLKNIKAFSADAVAKSTVNILGEIKKYRKFYNNQMENKKIENIKKHIDTFHAVIRNQSQIIEQTLNTHNQHFCHQWRFWKRETMLTGMLQSITENCPVMPKA